MAQKTAKMYVCSECGNTVTIWAGKCPSCGAWGSLAVREAPRTPSSDRANSARVTNVVDVRSPERISSGIEEFDRVLGGGFVPGSVALLGGQPGIGKSTLLLQVSGYLARSGANVLYISGEESTSQVALRARRLNAVESGLDVIGDTDLSSALEYRPGHAFVVVDSVQAMRAEEAGGPGTPNQVRAVASRVLEEAKKHEIPVVLVGHITKEGRIAGPMLLEHMVDVVLSFSGEEYSPNRTLRASKNRFGSTDEMAVFEMTEAGLSPVRDMSGLFWNKAELSVPGVALTVAVEGNTPLVVAIQTLAAPTGFPYPRRTARGVDINKLHLFSAVVEKRCRIPSSSWDIYVNVTGGLNLQEPAADLALCAALASAVRDAPIASGSCFIGEVGLAGEIRPVTRFPLRLREAARNGFTQVYASSLQETRFSGVPREKDLRDIRVVSKSRIFEVLEEVMR